MVRNGKAIVLLFAAGLLAANGCTVKEDRKPCPCYLDVDYRELLSSGLFAGEPGMVDVAVFLPELSARTTHPLASCPEMEEKTVSRDTARVVALVGNRLPDSFPDRTTQIRYEAGNQMDSLYVHTAEVDCSGEESTCVLRPLKQFSTLTFTDEEDGAILRSYNLVVRGTTCGLDAADLSALDGPYLYTVQERDRYGRISVRIPRQKESSLILDFYDKEDYQHSRWVFIFSMRATIHRHPGWKTIPSGSTLNRRSSICGSPTGKKNTSINCTNDEKNMLSVDDGRPDRLAGGLPAG